MQTWIKPAFYLLNVNASLSVSQGTSPVHSFKHRHSASSSDAQVLGI